MIPNSYHAIKTKKNDKKQKFRDGYQESIIKLRKNSKFMSAQCQVANFHNKN